MVNGMNTSLGRAPRHVDHRVALIARRRDVEEDELVGSLGVVAGRQLDRIAGVAEVDEVDALHHPTGVDVEARDDPSGTHPIDATVRRQSTVTAGRTGSGSAPFACGPESRGAEPSEVAAACASAAWARAALRASRRSSTQEPPKYTTVA